MPDEYVTSEFCKYASNFIDESLLNESSLEELPSMADDAIECDEFEKFNSMSTDDGIGTKKNYKKFTRTIT